jgi:Mn2+/Fe2+ NRAMP family transporter
MLAIPVMAGSTSYALAEARGKPEGLDLKPKQGRYFYGVIAASMVIGLALNFTGINPIQALVFAAVFNGVIAVPLIWFLNRIASDHAVMGAARSGPLSRTVLLITFIGMAGAVAAMAISYLHA